jgi:hypothetical protein
MCGVGWGHGGCSYTDPNVHIKLRWPFNMCTSHARGRGCITKCSGYARETSDAADATAAATVNGFCHTHTRSCLIRRVSVLRAGGCPMNACITTERNAASQHSQQLLHRMAARQAIKHMLSRAMRGVLLRSCRAGVLCNAPRTPTETKLSEHGMQ